LIVKVILAKKSLEGGFEPKGSFSKLFPVCFIMFPVVVSSIFRAWEKQFEMINDSEITIKQQ